MKRIIARLSDKDEKESCGNSNVFSSLLGRQFVVGGRSLVVEELIAEGGFGIVLKVRDMSYHCFALKRLCVNSEEDLKRCKQEVSILKSVNHKNIVRLVDSGVLRNQNGVFEVLMLLQYCRDRVTDLIEQSLSTRTSLKEQTVLRIFCDMCEAVGCLHEKNIIHRDLKLENILIADNGNYVLCDFGSATTESIVPRIYGISKTEEEISKYTTLAYRAPEMVDLYGDKEISTKADIWALGCLLYTLCFLKLPFKDSSLAIQSGEYSIPDYSDCGPKLLKLIGFMLQVDPGRRPDVYQVSALAFPMTSSYVTPLRNVNNSTVPTFDQLSLPNKESDVKAKPSTQTSFPSAPLSGEPVKTSVAPRQRPKVGGATSHSLTSLPPPVSHGRTRSTERRTDGDVYQSVDPSATDARMLQQASRAGSKENRCNDPVVTTACSQVGNALGTTCVESEKSLINLSADDANNRTSVDGLFDEFMPRQMSECLDSAKPNDSTTNANSTSLGDLDLLSFEPSVSASSVNPKMNCFPQAPLAGVGPAMGPRCGTPANARVGHRRLMSDTSAVTGPCQNLSGNYLRPPIRISHTPQWAPPRLVFPAAQQPLTASVSMDYIRVPAPAPQQKTPQQYQLPPRAQAPPVHVKQQQHRARPHHDYQHSGPVAAAMQTPNPSRDANSINPHHQWKHPLRGNRPLSSSSADLINLSGSGPHQTGKSTVIERPSQQLSQDREPFSSNLKNNRTISAVELDIFGSVPFSTMSIPPRPSANQGHTRSASHGQFFPKS